MKTALASRELLFRSIDRLGVNRIAFGRTRSCLRILCYHGAWTVARPHFGNKIFIGRDTFRQRLEALSSQRCNILPLREALDRLRAGTLPPRAVAITIDDGWASTFDFMLPELLRRRFPATIYLQTERLVSGAPVHDVAISYAIAAISCSSVTLPPWSLGDLRFSEKAGMSFALNDPDERSRLSSVLNKVFDNTHLADRKDLLQSIFELMRVAGDDLTRARLFHLGTPDDVRSADAHGFEIALHTHTHSLGDFSPEVIAGEIEANRAALGEILGRSPEYFKHFCYPSGDYTESALEDLANVGIDIATTCDRGFVSPGANPLCLPRILDGELTGGSEFLALVSGAKFLPGAMRGA